MSNKTNTVFRIACYYTLYDIVLLTEFVRKVMRSVMSAVLITRWADPELSIGPFCVTRSNPTRQLTDPTQPDPTQYNYT